MTFNYLGKIFKLPFPFTDRSFNKAIQKEMVNLVDSSLGFRLTAGFPTTMTPLGDILNSG